MADKMRKKWLAAAVVTALILSACGNRTGEGNGNNGGTSADANADNPLMENMAGAVNPENGTAGFVESTTGVSGSETVRAEISGSVNGTTGMYGPETAKTGSESGQKGAVVVQQEGSAGTIQVTLPEGWTYDLCPEGSDRLRMGEYGIHFYPEDASEGFIELCYMESFGVCGTGLEEKVMNLAGDEANIGTYDAHEYWDFVSFRGANKGMVALACEVKDWWPEYGEQTLSILDTVSLVQDKGDGAGDICGYPLAPRSADSVSTIACGTNQEPGENSGENSVIRELGLSLEILEATGTGATLVFRQSGGNPTGGLQYGSDFTLERYEEEAWIPVPVAVEGNYAFTAEAYNIPQDADREFRVDWEWLYGELEPGEYRIVKSVDDFRKSGDYDQYSIYASFEIYP